MDSDFLFFHYKKEEGEMEVSSFCILPAPSFCILKKEKQAYKIKKGDSSLLLLSSFSKRKRRMKGNKKVRGSF
jgi:hypothetical protein